MKKIFTLLLALAMATPFCMAPLTASATNNVSPTNALQNVGNATGFYNVQQEGENQLTQTVGNIISVFLGLLGIIFLVITLYAGILWMTAGGEEDKVTKARKWLTNGVIGLIIILAAYAISSFVISQLVSATGQG
jgi:hypothetical protein